MVVQTAKGVKYLSVIVRYQHVVEKNSMIISDDTIKAEGLGNFFKNLGKFSAKAGKKLATNVFENPGRALEIGANIATAAATKSPKAALSTLPQVINFYHTGKGLYLGKFV